MRRTSMMMILGWLTMVACDVDEPCGRGQRYEQGTCLTPAPPAMDSSVSTDAGCTSVVDDDIGTECSDDGECGCAAPFCAVQPGATKGYCTIQGCLGAGVECPTDYQCLDLSAFGVEPFCAPK